MFFFSVLLYYKILNVVPCAIQQDLVVYSSLRNQSVGMGSGGFEGDSELLSRTALHC